MRSIFAASICLLVAVLGGCAKQENGDVGTPTVAPPALTKGKAENGLALARTWCSSCHAVEAAGTVNDNAPSFAAIAERRDDKWIKTWLADPHPPMQGISLSNQEIADLTAYIKSLAPTPAP